MNNVYVSFDGHSGARPARTESENFANDRSAVVRFRFISPLKTAGLAGGRSSNGFFGMDVRAEFLLILRVASLGLFYSRCRSANARLVQGSVSGLCLRGRFQFHLLDS